MSHGASSGKRPHSKPPVLVAAAVILRRGRVLLSKRRRGTHLAGAWEFPGGKVEPGEDPRMALARELAEELGVAARVGDPIEVTFHAYPGKSVLLLFFKASLAKGSPPPRAIEVADVRWAAPEDLCDEAFPPADVGVLKKVRAILRAASRRRPRRATGRRAALARARGPRRSRP